jgi:hypothetical protein
MNFNSASQAFQPYLLTGERILWTGQPKQGFALRPADSFLIPFSLLWAGFALVWNIAVWTFPSSGEQPDLLFKLFGLPFLIIGIYMIVGRFIHDAAIRKAIRYAVTDQRALFLRRSKFSSLELSRLPKLELTEGRDGSGTIAFQNEPSLFNYAQSGAMSLWVPSLSAASQFFKIENPRHVYQLIRDNSARN